MNLDDGANAGELGIATHADNDALASEHLRAGDAVDQACARRRPGREAECVRSTDQPFT
jgi:hypothetical protein